MLKSKKVRRLVSYLQQGKVICGSVERTAADNRLILVTVCIELKGEGIYEVSVEEYYADVDVRALNLRDETIRFGVLEDVVRYIEDQFDMSLEAFHA